MDGERIIAYTEKDLQEKAAQHICARIIKHQKSSSSKFLLGLSPTNGQARRNRAKEVYSAIAEWNEQEIDWGRVLIILLDERYGYESDDDCNANLVQSSLVKTLQKRGIHFPEEQLIAPDTSQGWKEAAAEYQLRLSQILEDGKGFNLVSTGLGSDRSLGAIFPDWYAGNTERWLAASSKQLQVLCTETTGFEVPKRISVNLSAYRKAQHVVIFLGDKETWGSPDSPKSAQGEMDMAPRNSLPTGEFKRPRGKLRFSRSLSQQQIPDPIVTPLDFVTEQRYVCTAQVRRDVDRHLNLVIFGAAGDLAKKKTFPSIFQLHLNRVLPSNISVVACDDPGYHSNISNAETLLQNRLKPYLEKECSKPSDLREFAENLQFVPVDFKDAGTVRKLDEHLRSNAKKLQDNRIFYLALPPFLFETAVKFIREECWPENGYTRVIVEKPFGHDLQSAKALGSQVAQYLQESQVYRIDHYLAKNMVLNILALRFANRELGRLFHADNVSIVRITFKEDINVAGRAGYFDGYGIIRDVMQNHLLQLLTLVLMEAPASLDPEDVRDEKVKVLKQFRPVTREDCVVGQYDGYQDDPAIQAINEKQDGHYIIGLLNRWMEGLCRAAGLGECVQVLHLDNERWSKVPIIMKAGKSLERRSTIVRLQFKKAPPNSLFGDQPQNELVIRIQPDEAIYYRILAKTPGLSARAHEVQRTILDLDLRKEEVGRLPHAYEKLIHDVIQGESHNFVRADEVEEGWRIFDPLLQSLESPSAPHPFPYAHGTRGPPEADALINSTGYRRYTATGVQGLAQDFH